MQRRIFSREYKLEAVKLVRERVVTLDHADTLRGGQGRFNI